MFYFWCWVNLSKFSYELLNNMYDFEVVYESCDNLRDSRDNDISLTSLKSSPYTLTWNTIAHLFTALNRQCDGVVEFI